MVTSGEMAGKFGTKKFGITSGDNKMHFLTKQAINKQGPTNLVTATNYVKHNYYTATNYVKNSIPTATSLLITVVSTTP